MIKNDSINIINRQEFYNEIIEKSFLLEEPIIQKRELSELNSSSVNIIKIITIRENNKVLIIDAVLEWAMETKRQDNFHQLGLAMKLDVNTGEVVRILFIKVILNVMFILYLIKNIRF